MAIPPGVKGSRELFGDLAAQVDVAVKRGFRLAVHAIGNVGLTTALDTIQDAARSHGNSYHRIDRESFRNDHTRLKIVSAFVRLPSQAAAISRVEGCLGTAGGACRRNAAIAQSSRLGRPP